MQQTLLALKTAKRGAKVLIIDPKGDRWKWEQDLYTFRDQVKVTTFTADIKDKGKLDPFNIMRVGISKENYIERMKEAANWAMDICMFLIAADRKDPRTNILLQAVNRVVNKSNPAMNKIIEEIKIIGAEADKEENIIKKNMCNEIAETLNSYKQMAYSSLLFGDGDEEAISLERTVNVLQIQNLVFPDAETAPENYTFQEIVGYACLLAITGYIMLFIMSDRKELSIFEMDEATVLRATAAGKNISNKIIRMARALQSPGIFISQSIDDIGDSKVLNNIGYKFAFRTSDDEEIEKTLRAYGIEPTEENKEILSSLENGMCLFQDLEGRTGVVAIDAVFEEYINAFKTGAEDKEENEEVS
ncbi:ATP-binding protein [Caldisalinibacter kiritimatiensis]|nr:ATP-binding protein [Caldisalinibacter kiritimatiensis]